MKNLFKLLLLGLLIGSLASCDEEPKKKDLKKAVIENYAKMVHQNYLDSYNAAVKMQVKINAFVENPTAEGLIAAKKAWLEAREPYGETEVFRGSNGPIDCEDEAMSWAINNEGQINAWPLNEAYIDYVVEKKSYTGKGGIYDQSIIAGDTPITKEKLASLNEQGGDEAAVSTGWHAIEFLLWGQDNKEPSAFDHADDLSINTSGGNRPYTDFTTLENADRRKLYLKVVTELLIDDLKALVDTWAKGGTYYTVFMALDQNVALKNIISGPQFLAMSELSSERMLVPAYGSGGINKCGQEDEHSCFADNTHRDVYLNAKGIVNVLKGKYGSVSGTSFIDLVKDKDAKLGEELENLTNKMFKAIEAIDAKAKAGTPFDLMILNEGKGKHGEVIKAAILLDQLGALIKECAAKLDIQTSDRDDLGATVDPKDSDDEIEKKLNEE